MKVLAAIVTFNRLELLKRCIQNINKQTRKAEDLLIINNSSTDGTSEYLISNNYNHINQKNSGSAGGWHSAINYAIKNNFDAIWLMDDDGYPKFNSLDQLTKKYDNQYSCLSSIVMNENNHSNLIFPMPVLNKNNLPVLFSYQRKKYNMKQFTSDEIKINEYNFCHLFNGALLSIKHIKLIGNINVKYFMYGDEVDYYFRLRKVGKAVSVLSSYHFHPDVSQRPLNTMKLYYYIKNSIILNFKYFDHSFTRSILNILIGILRLIIRNNLKTNFVFLFSFKIKYIFLAILRGFKGRIEIDYEE